MAVAKDKTGRFKNINWDLRNDRDEITDAHLAVLMDIRDELQRLRGIFGCTNFLFLPRVVQEIATNTKKRVRKEKEKGKAP